MYRVLRDEHDHGVDTLACARAADGGLAAFDAPGWNMKHVQAWEESLPPLQLGPHCTSRRCVQR